MLKQIKPEKMILFLNLFTQELIQNSKPKIREISIEETKTSIQTKESTPPEILLEESAIAKIPKKEFVPQEVHYTPSPLIPSESFPIKKTIPKIPKIKPKYPLHNHPIKTQIRKPIQIHLPPPKLLPKLKQPFPPPRKLVTEAQTPTIQTKPLPAQIRLETREVNLGRLNALLYDKEITTIECPGPEKFILIKKAGEINLTKIKLTQKEIEGIIKNFSEKSRIPLFGGIFKAAIGDLAISAVFSEIAGSRFIIYKKTLYSLVE